METPPVSLYILYFKIRRKIDVADAPYFCISSSWSATRLYVNMFRLCIGCVPPASIFS